MPVGFLYVAASISLWWKLQQLQLNSLQVFPTSFSFAAFSLCIYNTKFLLFSDKELDLILSGCLICFPKEVVESSAVEFSKVLGTQLTDEVT